MRYLQVDDAPKPLTINSVRFVRRHYELDRSRSSFRSSNPMLNQVWDLMKHSLTLGAQETFVDTPTREKAGFLGDVWSQGVAAMTTMGDRTMNLRVLLEFLDSQDQYWLDGRLNAVYPNSDGRRDIPDYTQSYLVWVWDYFMQTGNTEFLRANYNRLRKIGDYVDAHRHESTGLIHNLAGGGGDYLYGIIDWPPQMRYGYDMSVASRTVINAYACVDYDILARIATVLGHSSDRERYTQRARAMRRAINTHLLTARGVYCDGLNADGSRSPHISQHANMFPLALGIVPDAHYASVLAAVKERQMSVGMVTVRWLTEALGESDQGPHLMRLYTDTDWDGWARTILLGATATWESWNADTNGQSMSHPWGAAGLIGIHQYILGIRPLKPQHELVQVKPLAFGTSLSVAAGTLPTDRGDISVDWNRNNERFLMTVTLPDNVTARVYLPKCGISGAALKVDGVEVTGTEEDGYVFLDNIGSGIHTFERAAAPRGRK